MPLALSPAALMPLGIHIRQISPAHVTPITYMPDTYRYQLSIDEQLSWTTTKNDIHRLQHSKKLEAYTTSFTLYYENVSSLI